MWPCRARPVVARFGKGSGLPDESAGFLKSGTRVRVRLQGRHGCSQHFLGQPCAFPPAAVAPGLCSRVTPKENPCCGFGAPAHCRLSPAGGGPRRQPFFDPQCLVRGLLVGLDGLLRRMLQPIAKNGANLPSPSAPAPPAWRLPGFLPSSWLSPPFLLLSCSVFSYKALRHRLDSTVCSDALSLAWFSASASSFLFLRAACCSEKPAILA